MLVTKPLPEMVASAGLLLLQVPPGVASLSEAVEPRQTAAAPVMAAGDGMVVNVKVVLHPTPVEYVIVAEPGAMPLTRPDDASTLTMAGLLELHVPPGTPSVK